jgi:hypothetical protein
MPLNNTITEEEGREREAYYVALARLRAKIDEVERACVEDAAVRSAVQIAAESYTTQLEALRKEAARRRRRARRG